MSSCELLERMETCAIDTRTTIQDLRTQLRKMHLCNKSLYGESFDNEAYLLVQDIKSLRVKINQLRWKIYDY